MEPSAELYAPNNKYGHAAIVKSYTDWPYGRPLPALIPHGAVFKPSTHDVFTGEAETPYKAVLNWEPSRREAWTRTDKEVIDACHPFVYLLRMSPRPKFPPATRGLIHFPDHSTEGIKIDDVWSDLADELLRLPAEYQPVTVCLYYADIADGHAQHFLERKIPLHTAGGPYDVQFLARVLTMMREHRYVASNEVGTNTAMALMAGSKYRIVGEKRVNYRYLPLLGEHQKQFTGTAAREATEKVREGLLEDPDAGHHADWAHEILGADNMVSPMSLRATLETIEVGES